MGVYLSDNNKNLIKVAGKGAKGTASLPLGMILPTAVVSDDACLHLLDGSSLAQSGIYAEFCTWLKNRVLANSSNVPTCTISEYASEMTTYGQCGKFVINNTGSDQSSGGYTVYANSIKLPTITEFIASNNGGDAIGLAELDEFKRHAHNVGANNVHNYTTSGDNFSLGSVGYPINNWNRDAAYTGGEETRPKNIRYPYYIVVATATKTDVQVNIDNVSNDINAINSTLNNISNELLIKPFKSINYDKQADVSTTTKSVLYSETINFPRSGIYKFSITAVISTSTQVTSLCPYLDGTQYNSPGTNLTSATRVTGTFFANVTEGDHLFEIAIVTQSTNATGTFYAYNHSEATIEYISSENGEF